MEGIDRRTVLAAIAAGAVAVTGATGAGVWAVLWDRPVGEGLQVLSNDEHAFVQALAEAWMPRGGEPEMSGADADLGGFVDAFVAPWEPGNAVMFKALLQALDKMPLAAHGGRFRKLSLETRQGILRRWLDSEQWLIRSAINSVVVMLGLGWTSHPDVAPLLRPMINPLYGRP